MSDKRVVIEVVLRVAELYAERIIDAVDSGLDTVAADLLIDAAGLSKTFDVVSAKMGNQYV